MASPVDLVIQRLSDRGRKPRRAGGSWQALCPAHDDQNPSLNVSEGRDGCAVVTCFAGCPTERVLDELDLGFRDLFADAGKQRMNIVAEYDYPDENGVLLSQAVRLSPKDFRQRRPDGNGGWSWNLDGVRRVLYQLPDVLAGVNAGRWIIVVEGERDADRVRALGLVATTNSGGAGKWRDDYADVLTGAKVAVIPDNDAPGNDHAEAVARSLHGRAATVKVIDLDVPDKGDMSDWLDAGHDALGLKRLIDTAPEWHPAEEAASSDDDHDTSIAPDGFRCTDTGNSGRFTKLTLGRIKHVHAWGKWLHLQRGRWVLDEGDVLVKELGKRVGPEILKLATSANVTRKEAEALFQWGLQTEGSGRITAMVHLSRGAPGLLVEHESLDADPDILNVLNGTIELRTGELRPHRADDLCTRQAPVEYDPDARSDLWDACLERWQPDAEMRAYLQLEAGAATTGYPTETLSVHYGGGANGKSRFWGAIQTTLGPYAVVPHKSLLLVQRYEQHETVKADLFRARLAVASETDAAAVLDDEQVKGLTGGDRMRARRMREDPWYFDPSHTLVVFSNHRPRIQGRDEGVWRRLRLVPWTVTIPVEERDEHLADKLRQAQPAILAWLVEGARRYLTEGFTPPEPVRVATEAYRASEDVPGRAVREMFTITEDPMDWLWTADMVETVTEWATSQGLTPPSIEEITDLFKAHGCTSKQRKVGGRRGMTWRGLRFSDEVVTG
jgi:putative DNA primase/helicase